MFPLISGRITCEEDEEESDLHESGVSCDRIHVLHLEESAIRMNERTIDQSFPKTRRMSRHFVVRK